MTIATVHAQLRCLWYATEVSRSAKTSRLRALAVCLLTPLPALVFVVVVEAALPLAPLTAPLLDPYNLSIRVGASALVVAFSTIMMARQFAPDMPLQRLNSLRIAALTAVLYSAAITGYTYFWSFWGQFPAPFVMPQTIGFFWISLTISCRLFEFKSFKNASSEDIQRWKLCVKQNMVVLGWAGLLQIVYPVYGALFVWLKGPTQLVVVTLPSLFKIFTKAKIATLCRANVVDMSEAIPQLPPTYAEAQGTCSSSPIAVVSRHCDQLHYAVCHVGVHFARRVGALM